MTAAPLHVEVTGLAGAPAVLLGISLGTTAAMWEPQVEALTRRWRVVRFEHRGHGGSAVPPGPYTLDMLGGDVVAMLDDLGLERVAYCGLSLGGMVGMWLGAHAPERVERLALLSTSAHVGPASMWAERAQRVRRQGTAPEVEASLGRWFTPRFRRLRPDVTEAAGGWLRQTPREGYAACCEAIASMDLRADLPGIAAPTMVIAAAGDSSTPPSHAEQIADAIPGARLAILDDAAHLVNIEQPQAVTRLLLEHLAD